MPERPSQFIAITANNSDSGIVTATTKPARRSPRSKNSHADDEQRALGQVRENGADRVAKRALNGRKNGSILVPGGRDGWSTASLFFTACVTVREFSPSSINATPTTTSPLPSCEGRATAQPRSEAHIADGGNRDRHALCGRADHGLAQVVEALDQAAGADHEVLARVLDVAAARVGVRKLERGHDLRDRDACGLAAASGRARPGTADLHRQSC